MLSPLISTTWPSIPVAGKSEKFWTPSKVTLLAWFPYPSEALTESVPEDLTILKLLSPISVRVIFAGEPIALLTPSLIVFVFVVVDE